MIARPFVRTIFAAFLLCATAQAASPRLTGVRPLGGQRGTELEVHFTGERLGDAQEILFYQSGISASKIERVDANHVKALVKIESTAALGLVDLRVRTATGVSELRTFSVGALKELTEVEPNDEFTKPQKIEFGSVVNGVARSEDVDYYAFEAKKGGPDHRQRSKGPGSGSPSSILTSRSWIRSGSSSPPATTRP